MSRSMRIGSVALVAGLTTLWMAAAALAAPPTAAKAAPQAAWKAGAASVVLTPQQPMWMAGYASRNKPSEGKFQDLFGKALVLEDAAGARLAVVTLDLISVPRTLRDAVEKQVCAKYGLRPEGLLINASHTHSGPVMRAGKSFYNQTPELQQRTEQYAAALPEKLAALVGKAVADMAPARLAYCHARAGFAMNRRFPTKNGYQNRPNPDGPVDHDVPVLRVERADGKLRAVLFGYACHNTTLPLYKFCGDYAGYAQEYFELANPGVTALFAIGCGGDQNPYPRGKLELAQQHGRTLATAVEAALTTEPRPLNGLLRMAIDEAPLEYAAVPSREQLLQTQKKGNQYEQGHAKRVLEALDRDGSLPKSHPCLVQVIRFGEELVMVALPGEPVVDYSLRLKRELAGPAVWVLGYSNDAFGYIPSARVLGEGGYEAGGAILYTSTPSPFSPKIEDAIVGKAKELFRATQGK